MVSFTVIFNSVTVNMQDCVLEEVLDDEDPPRSSKDNKKVHVADMGKDPSLVFKITHKIAYKNVLKGTFGIYSLIDKPLSPFLYPSLTIL